MKPIIAVDFDGALLKSRPFDKAHKRWFYVMSVMLKDDSVNWVSRGKVKGDYDIKNVKELEEIIK